MNHDCNGDLFDTELGRHYRCLMDGTCIPLNGPLGDICPNCKRKAAATEHEQPLPTRKFIATQVKVPSFGWCDMAWLEIPETRS